MKEKRRNENLEELEHKHWYDISDDDPKVLDWNIVDDSGKKIGVVRDLLFDKEAKKARYLITNLKDGMAEKDIRVLVPIGRARLDRTDKRIVLPAVSLQQLNRLPEYRGVENLSADDENVIREIFAGNETGKRDPETHDRKNFYEHDDFREEHYLNQD